MPIGTQIEPSNYGSCFSGSRLMPKSGEFGSMIYAVVSLRSCSKTVKALPNVKEQMDHSSNNVTVDIYGHLVPEGNRQAVDKLDDALPAVAKKQLR